MVKLDGKLLSKNPTTNSRLRQSYLKKKFEKAHLAESKSPVISISARQNPNNSLESKRRLTRNSPNLVRSSKARSNHSLSSHRTNQSQKKMWSTLISSAKTRKKDVLGNLLRNQRRLLPQSLFSLRQRKRILEAVTRLKPSRTRSKTTTLARCVRLHHLRRCTRRRLGKSSKVSNVLDHRVTRRNLVVRFHQKRWTMSSSR